MGDTDQKQPVKDWPRVALIGFMASGKSAVARALSSLFDGQVYELDHQIERDCGKKISEIFADEGEASFRKRESEALQAALGERPTVLSTGGGIVELPTNIEAIQAADYQLVYLATPMREIRSRLSSPEERNNRPLAADSQSMLDLFTRRIPLYREYADLVISTSGKSPGEVAREIVESLEE